MNISSDVTDMPGSHLYLDDIHINIFTTFRVNKCNGYRYKIETKEINLSYEYHLCKNINLKRNGEQ